MHTDLLIDGYDSEDDERRHSKRVLARRQESFDMLETLRLELDRHRSQGVEFPEAWKQARKVALPKVGFNRERGAWSKALNATEGHWERAYLRLPDEWATKVAHLGEVS